MAAILELREVKGEGGGSEKTEQARFLGILNAVKVISYIVKEYLLGTYSRPDLLLSAENTETASPFPVFRKCTMEHKIYKCADT